MNKLLRVNLLALLCVAVFDPADVITNLKVPLFMLTWLIVLVDIILLGNSSHPVPKQMLSYVVLLSLVIPLTSIAAYLIFGGGLAEFDGFKYLKSYLFLTIAIPLAMKGVDLIRPLCLILTPLSLATIASYLAISFDETLWTPLWLAGDTLGSFALSERTFGSLTLLTVYFHASPLLVIAVAYFSYLNVRTTWRPLWVLVLALNIVALFLSGRRNNIMAAILIPTMVVLWYRKVNWRHVATLLVLASALLVGADIGSIFFDPDEYSNALKIAHFRDYVSALDSSWRTLFLGQGLGSTFYSTALGTNVSITELTYLELIRSYGFLGAAVLMGLLVYPLRALRRDSAHESHYLFLAYLFYLFMCASNPLLFSSSGMLILAMVLQKAFSMDSEMAGFAAQQPSHRIA